MKLEDISADSLTEIIKHFLIFLVALIGSVPFLYKSIFAKKRKNRISDLKTHNYFDVLRNEQLWINREILTFDHEKKNIEIRSYISFKIEWWRKLMLKLIDLEFNYDGGDMLNDTNAFAKFMYGRDGFGERRQYFIERGITTALIDSCQRLITNDIVEATDKTVASIIVKRVELTRFQKADAIMDVFAQGIIFDNRSVIRHAKNFDKTWDKELGIEK